MAEATSSVLTMGSGDPHGPRPRDRGASLLGLLIGLVTMALMAVIVVKVIDRQDADVHGALDRAPALSDLAGGTTTQPPGSTGPAGLPGAATQVACLTEKQSLETAEGLGQQAQGRALTVAELVAAGFLKEPPNHYEVVVQPDGTPLVRPLDPAVCP